MRQPDPNEIPQPTAPAARPVDDAPRGGVQGTALDAAGPRLRDIVAALCDGEAEFLVVGSFGSAPDDAAGDGSGIDIFVRPAAENAARVWRALQRFGAPAGGAIGENALATAGVVHAITAAPRPVNLVTAFDGVTFEQAWQSRVVVDWDGRPVGVLGHGASLAARRTADQERAKGA